MDHYGFVMIPRAALFDEEILSSEKPFTKAAAFLWIFREARIKPTVIFVGGRKIDLKKRQISFSYRFLSEKFGWNLGKTQRYIKRLKIRGFIDTDTSQGQLVVTICDARKSTREETHEHGRTDTSKDTASDTKCGQRKNIENIDIENKEHLLARSNQATATASSVQNDFLALLRNAGVSMKRGNGLLNKWERKYGLETTNKALEKCLTASPKSPIAWVISNLNGNVKNERNSESGKSLSLGAAADRIIHSQR